MYKSSQCLAIVVSLLGSVEVLKADFIYSVTVQTSSLVLAPSQTTTATLILNESDVAGINSPISLDSGSGLFGIALRLERTSGDATLSNFQLAPGLNPFGVNPNPNPTTTSALWQFNANAGFASFGTGPRSSLVIGTVDITMGSQTSTFQLGNLTTPVPNNLSLGTLVNQRPTSISSYGSTTITAVPEPNSAMLIIGCIASFTLVRRQILG
jgi:hypothetical protein